jgi:hypothetical protein
LFQKGNKLSKGGQKLDPDLRGVKLLNQREVEKLVNKLLSWPVRELEAYSIDKNNPAGDVMVARVVIEAIRSGDEKRLEFIYNRLLGKPRETRDVNVKNGNLHDELMRLQDELERDVTPRLGYHGDQED